ncbi:MAG TPA: hypothetical protein VN704_00900 [Verrucomicrobiae bacterium]|nr:hypothetical protein [Verrucomicrobiae bacterium]
MKEQHLIQPYRVGKNKKSLAVIIPSEFVKLFEIDPSTVLLLLKAQGYDEIQLKIIREDLINKISRNDVLPVGRLSPTTG